MNVKRKHSTSQRFLAMLLSIMMVFTIVPSSAFAAVKENDIVSAVTAPDAAAYTVENGTALQDAGLPATLQATVSTPPAQEGGEAAIREESLAVTWEGSYDAFAAGDYTLTAKFADQTALAEDVIMPAITVTVGEAAPEEASEPAEESSEPSEETSAPTEESSASSEESLVPSEESSESSTEDASKKDVLETPEESKKSPTVLSLNSDKDFYIRINTASGSVLTTTDGVNCDNFDIGKKGTANFNFDFSVGFSSANTVNRKIIISLPLGFTINDSSWPKEITNSLTSKPMRVTTPTANVYTLNVKDEHIITSISGTLSANQEASYLLKNLTENQVYTFSMDVYDGSEKPSNSKQFTMTPISTTPVYTISQWENTVGSVQTPSSIFQTSSEDKDVAVEYNGKLEYDNFNGTQKGTRVDIHKTAGHLSDSVTFTIPFPNTLDGVSLSNALFAGNGIIRLYFTPEGSTTATYFEDASWGNFNKDTQTLSFTKRGTAYVNDGVGGKEISDMLTQAGTISCVFSYKVYQNRFAVEETGTLLGTPAAMGTTITYKAADKSSVAYQKFDGAQTAATAEGPPWELKYKNNDKIKLDHITRPTSYWDKFEWAQGNIMSGKTEVIEKGDKTFAVHSNAVITYEYEEAFSPVNFTLNNTKEKDFSYKITVTKLDANGNVASTQEFVYQIKDTATTITAADLGLSDQAYVSKVEARNPSLSSYYVTQDYQSGALIFTADYKAKKNTVRGVQAGTDEIPEKYPATVTIKTKSDQIAEQTFTKQVILREVIDNIQATPTLYGNRNTFPVNKHDDPGSYWYASVDVTKKKDTMNYNEDGAGSYPELTISGAAVGLCDLVSTTNGVLRGYTDQGGTYIALTDASGYIATVPMVQHTSTQELAADFSVYDMRKVFKENGSLYATSITMELTAVNEWVTSTSVNKPIFLGATNTTPGYLNYDNVVGTNGTADLDKTYEISAELECNSDSHIDFNHDSKVGASKKLVLGERETTASFRTLDYDFIHGTSSDQVMDGNPQLLASMTFRGLIIPGAWVGREMDYQEFTIDLSESDEDLLALTQGISLTAETFNVGRLTEIDVILKYTTKNQMTEHTTDVIRMKGTDRLVSINPVYNDITNLLQGEGDYFTSLKICIPNETAVGVSNKLNTAIPSVALRRADPLPKVYPVSGDVMGAKTDLDTEGDAYDRLEAKATISYQDIFGTTDTRFTATGKTSRLKVPVVQVSRLGRGTDNGFIDITYTDAGTGTPQGGSFDVRSNISYQFSEATKAIDPELELKPVLYYQIHKEFIPDVSKITYGNSFNGVTEIYPTFVPAGTGVGASGDSDYGYLIIDFTNASSGLQSAQKNAYGSIKIPLSVSYTATVGKSSIPINAVWFDLPSDRDEKGKNPVAQERKYGVDMINTTDGAPYGEAFGNDQSADYPAKTTDASKKTATMLRWEYTATKNITKYTTAGLLTTATAAMPYQSGASVTSKDILEADASMLFGTAVTYIGPESSATENWISYIPVPTGEFGLKLVGIDTTELAKVLPTNTDSYKIYYTEDKNPSTNGVSHTGGTTPDVDTSTYILWDNDATKLANATMLRIEIPKFIKDGRGTVYLKYIMRERKAEVGNKVNTMTTKVNYTTSSGAWVSENGMDSPPLTYTLTDMTLKGTVWSESDYTSLYDPADGLDTLFSGVTMKLIDPKTGTEVVQTGNNNGTSDNKGAYTLIMPHDGKWNVTFDLPDDKQLVTQYSTTKGQTEHNSNESWFHKETAVAQIDFTSDYQHNSYTMETVSAGMADKRKITLTPSDVVMHAGKSQMIVADVKVDDNFPAAIEDKVVFAQALDTDVAGVADNSDKTAQITTNNSGKTTATVSIPDGYYLDNGGQGLLTHTYHITSYVNVKYDGNDATSGNVPEDETTYYPSLNSDGTNAKTDVVTVAEQGGLERTGYRFLGWTTSLAAGATDYLPGATFETGSVATDITLYARWEANSYKVTFDGNGGTGSIQDMDFVYDQAQNLSKNEQGDGSFLINRPGYKFLGWNTDQTAASSGTASYTDEEEVKNLASAHQSKVTLYAVWAEQDAVTITYKSEDTAKGTVTKASEAVSPVTGEATGSKAIKEDGHTFVNWTVGADVEVSTNPEWKPSKNADGLYEAAEYTAHFTENNYKVKYNTGFADVTVQDKEPVKWNDSGLLPEQPKKDGYGFIGWELDKKQVTATDKYSSLTTDQTDGSFITLVATWAELADYSVLYNTNGGSMPTDIPSTITGIKYNGNVPTPTPVQNGFTFKGWTYKDTAVTDGSTYNALAKDDTIKQIELVAQWTAKEYTVKYDTQGAGTIEDKTGVKYADASLLPTDTITKDGYTFLGWKCGDTTVTNGNTYESLAKADTLMSITLVAEWKENVYKVKYETGFADVTVQDKEPVKWNDSGLLPEQPKKDGYGFIGWELDKKQVTATDKYSSLTTDQTDGSFITLAAKWVELTDYSVLYNTNGGSMPTDIPSTITGMKYKDIVLTPTPVQNGFTFKSWTYKDTDVTDGSTYNTLAKDDTIKQIELVAQWTAKEYTVKYDTQGGAAIADKTGVKYADASLLPTDTTTKDGYTFLGWKYGDITVTNENTYESLATDDTLMSITLVAEWKENIYKVKYETGFKDVTVPDKEQVKWNDSNLLPEMPKKDGYGFIGWELDKKQVTATDKYSSLTTEQTDGSFITLVAKWAELTDYSVLYNTNGGSMPTDIPSTITGMKYKDNVPTPIPVRDGYTFKGWTYKDTAVKDGSTYNGLAKDHTIKQIELVAQWEINKYTVDYKFVSEKNPDGISVPKGVTVEYDTTTNEPKFTEPNNWTFDGWYLDKECTLKFNFNTPIKADMTLYGKWTYKATEKPKPSAPTNPKNPTNPTRPTTPSTSNRGTNVPKTGDTSNVAVPFALLILSSGLLILLIVKRRKTNSIQK